MSQIPTRSTASGGDPPRRAHHIPLEEVIAVQEKLGQGRRDKHMIPAFDLENDKPYWNQMKNDALTICRHELPPRRLSPDTRKRLNISNDEAKTLSYCGGTSFTKEFLWKYATVPWREKYAYDLEYLQRKYPTLDIQVVVTGMFSCWNSSSSFVESTRSWGEGRNLAETLLQCNNGQLKLKGLASNTANSHTATTDNAEGVEASDGDEYESDLNKSVSRLEVREPQRDTLRENLERHIQSEDDEKAPVVWKSVILSMYHIDTIKGEVDRIPLRTVCANDARSIMDVDAKKLEEEMDDQGIATSDYLLVLRGCVNAVGWRRTNIVHLLTVWERTRSNDEYEVPLLLIPKDMDQDGQLPTSETNNSHQHLSAPAAADLKIQKEQKSVPPDNDTAKTNKRSRPESPQLIDDDDVQHKGSKDRLKRQRRATAATKSAPRITRQRRTQQRAEMEDGKEEE